MSLDSSAHPAMFSSVLQVRENQGVSEDNLSSPTPPQFIPPIHMLTPWFFEATMLSNDYDKGKLIAYQLLCDLSFRTHDIPLSAEYVTRCVNDARSDRRRRMSQLVFSAVTFQINSHTVHCLQALRRAAQGAHE